MNFSSASVKMLHELEQKMTCHKKTPLNYWAAFIYLSVPPSLIFLIYDFTRQNWFNQSFKLFIVVGVAGAISWLTTMSHIFRIIYYQKVYLPKLMRQQSNPAARVAELFVIVPTYKEQDWITHAVFRSISREVKKISIPVTIIVISPDEYDFQKIRETLTDFPLSTNAQLITLKQQGKGKRNALAESLRYIQKNVKTPKAVVGLMDGDCIWGDDLLSRVIPVFEKNLKLGGITTNEELICFGSKFYEKWFDYRLAFRDFYMKSHSFSKSILCLTGRFSVVRLEIAVNDEFIWIVENDNMDHWLWGKIKFLGGDDKSTWFWIFKNGNRYGLNEMLYLPEALVYTIESIKENGFIRAQKNLRRWFTNTARNHTRSLLVPPIIRTPLFIWLCILGQRITMYTNVMGIIAALVLGILVNPIYIPAFLYLSIFNAFVSSLIFSINRKRLLYWGVFIQLINQWIGTVVKLWAFSHISQQRWVHRGGQQMGVGGHNFIKILKITYAKYEFVLKIIFIFTFILITTGVLNPFKDIELMWSGR